MALLFFFVFAGVAVLGGVAVLVSRNPLHAALGMIGTMLALAAIYLLHNAEFIFAIQVMVYAGAVMMLIVFVIMLLNLREEEATPAKLSGGKFFAVALSGVMFLLLLVPLGAKLTGMSGEMTEATLAATGSVGFIAEKLFTHYLLPFEVASVLLLVGLVGAVSLAKKKL